MLTFYRHVRVWVGVCWNPGKQKGGKQMQDGVSPLAAFTGRKTLSVAWSWGIATEGHMETCILELYQWEGRVKNLPDCPFSLISLVKVGPSFRFSNAGPSGSRGQAATVCEAKQVQVRAALSMLAASGLAAWAGALQWWPEMLRGSLEACKLRQEMRATGLCDEGLREGAAAALSPPGECAAATGLHQEGGNGTEWAFLHQNLSVDVVSASLAFSEDLQIALSKKLWPGTSRSAHKLGLLYQVCSAGKMEHDPGGIFKVPESKEAAKCGSCQKAQVPIWECLLAKDMIISAVKWIMKAKDCNSFNI